MPPKKFTPTKPKEFDTGTDKIDANHLSLEELSKNLEEISLCIEEIDSVTINDTPKRIRKDIEEKQDIPEKVTPPKSETEHKESISKPKKSPPTSDKAAFGNYIHQQNHKQKKEQDQLLSTVYDKNYNLEDEISHEKFKQKLFSSILILSILSFLIISFLVLPSLNDNKNAENPSKKIETLKPLHD